MQIKSTNKLRNQTTTSHPHQSPVTASRQSPVGARQRGGASWRPDSNQKRLLAGPVVAVRQKPRISGALALRNGTCTPFVLPEVVIQDSCVENIPRHAKTHHAVAIAAAKIQQLLPSLRPVSLAQAANRNVDCACCGGYSCSAACSMRFSVRTATH